MAIDTSGFNRQELADYKSRGVLPSWYKSGGIEQSGVRGNSSAPMAASAAPATLQPLSTDLSSLDSAPLQSSGTYGEGQVSDILQRLRSLKGQLTSGNIDSQTYLQYASPLVEQASSITGSIASGGGKAASAVNPIWQQIQNANFAKADQGKWVASLPLTEQEFASLPDSAKPTADQINQGLVPTSSLPGNVGLNTLINQQQQQQTGLSQQAQQQTQQQQQQTMQQLQQIFGQLGNQQLQQATQNLTTGPQGEQLREYYNSMGLLNSGAFEQGLANQFGQVEQGIANQGLGALANQTSTSGGQIQDLINSAYGTNSGLGQAGLQRQFSLTDFFNNADLQKQLADLQNNQYMSAINQQQQNPWTQLALGAGSGLAQGFGQYLGRKA